MATTQPHDEEKDIEGYPPCRWGELFPKGRVVKVVVKKMKLDALKDYLYDVVGAIYETHRELGPGLNEYVYQEGLEMQLEDDNIAYEREREYTPIYHDRKMNAKYRLDFVCKNQIIVECKAVEQLTANHRAQLFNYMRLTKLPMGILVNFSPKSAEIERYFFDAQRNEIISIDGTILTRFNK